MTPVPVLTSVHALLVAGALVLSAPAAFAETTPRPGPHDNRVRIATWTEGQVYRIVTTLTRVTTVEFGEGETIRSIIAGDKRTAFTRVNWQEVGRKPGPAKLKCIDIGRNRRSKVLAAIGPDALTLHLGDNSLAEPSNALGINIAMVRSQVDMTKGTSNAWPPTGS